MKWSNLQNNFWNIVVHLFAIIGATYFWTTEIGNNLIDIIEGSNPPPKGLSGTSALDRWFEGAFTANTPVLVTFVFYFAIFLLIAAFVKKKRIDVKENSKTASIIRSIANLASNILSLILIFSCISIGLTFIAFSQGTFTNINIVVFICGWLFLIIYFFLACFHRFVLDDLESYINSKQRIGR
ncbi:hypothetical protein Q5X54_07015 [Acinetobacter baumannii]|nr:hypothetical protein [Acinetobacter baumannii]MDV7490143.1 hypothetical protein [Acinetobacter baumannii]